MADSTTKVYCIDDEDDVEASDTSKIGGKRKSMFDEPIDLTEEDYLPQKNDNHHEQDDDDGDDDQVQVIIPLHTLLSRFRDSINTLIAPISSSTAVSSRSQQHSHQKKKTTSKKANNNSYGFGFGFGYGANQAPPSGSSSSWGSGVGYGGSSQAGLLSTSKSVQQAQKKVSQEDSQATLAFRGIHFCLTANEGVISQPLLNEVSKHRLLLLGHLERRLKNDSLMDIAGRKDLYLAILDTLQSIIDNDSLMALFLNPTSTLDTAVSSSSSVGSSLLERLRDAVTTYVTSPAPTAPNQEPEEPTLHTCHQWLRQLQQQATTFLRLQRSAGNTVDEEFMDTLEIAAHLQSTFQSLGELVFMIVIISYYCFYLFLFVS